MKAIGCENLQFVRLYHQVCSVFNGAALYGGCTWAGFDLTGDCRFSPRVQPPPLFGVAVS